MLKTRDHSADRNQDHDRGSRVSEVGRFFSRRHTPRGSGRRHLRSSPLPCSSGPSRGVSRSSSRRFDLGVASPDPDIVNSFWEVPLDMSVSVESGRRRVAWGPWCLSRGGQFDPDPSDSRVGGTCRREPTGRYCPR